MLNKNKCTAWIIISILILSPITTYGAYSVSGGDLIYEGSTRTVEAEFNKIINEPTAEPNQYYGNTNTQLNQIIQCAKFGASKDDPACQSTNYTSTFESFVKKNFSKNTVDELINNTKTPDNNSNNKNNTNGDNDNSNNNKNNNQYDNTPNKDYIAKNDNNNDTAKKKMVDTGVDFITLIYLIFSTFSIVYSVWIYKITITLKNT